MGCAEPIQTQSLCTTRYAHPCAAWNGVELSSQFKLCTVSWHSHVLHASREGNKVMSWARLQLPAVVRRKQHNCGVNLPDFLQCVQSRAEQVVGKRDSCVIPTSSEASVHIRDRRTTRGVPRERPPLAMVVRNRGHALWFELVLREGE